MALEMVERAPPIKSDQQRDGTRIHHLRASRAVSEPNFHCLSVVLQLFAGILDSLVAATNIKNKRPSQVNGTVKESVPHPSPLSTTVHSVKQGASPSSILAAPLFLST